MTLLTRNLGLALVAIASSQASAQDTKVDRGIGAGDRSHQVFVRMADQVLRSGSDYAKFCDEHAGAKRRELRATVIEELEKKSEAAWKAVQPALKKLGDEVRSVERYWVVNGFACVATGHACQELAKLEEVAFVYRKPQRVPGLHKDAQPARPFLRDPEKVAKRALAQMAAGEQQPFPKIEELKVDWNLEKIHAPAAWKSGALGEGITIAILDSGLLVTPALTRALWRNPKEELNGKDDDGNGYVDDLFGYDFVAHNGISLGDPRFPCHGSACASVLAGRPIEIDGKQVVTGVAPKARIMVLRGMGVVKAYEYALRQGADVVSMSYMWVNTPLGNWRGLYRLAHEHMTIAGIVSVGGSGNFGMKAPEGKQICLPKDIPCVISASGVGEDGKMPPFSSRGPCTWDDVKFYGDFPSDKPLIKPDVTTVNKDFAAWIALPPNARGRLPRNFKLVHQTETNVALLRGLQGNSFAGPHAGGVAALMLSANPDLPAWKVKELMEKTCEDLGRKGRDTDFGAGLVNALAAVEAARKAR